MPPETLPKAGLDSSLLPLVTQEFPQIEATKCLKVQSDLTGLDWFSP